MDDWERKTWPTASEISGSQGYTLYCAATGKYGLAKPLEWCQDVPASLLAAAVGVAMPVTKLGMCEGQTVAVSEQWYTESWDLRLFRSEYPAKFNSPGIQDARRRASGVLAFYAWTGLNGDHKDNHLLVRPGAAAGTYDLAVVDFQYAFKPDDLGQEPIRISGPECLIEKEFYDEAVCKAVIKNIETLPEATIASSVSGVPESVWNTERKRCIVVDLVRRQTQLSATFDAIKWPIQF